jgi:hypothetical protein
MKRLRNNKTGSALLMTMLILSSIMVVALNAAGLVMSGVILSGTQERSTIAFYAAEAGAERALYEARRNPGFTLPMDDTLNIFGTTTLSNGAYNLVDYSSSTPDIFFSSEGNYAETKRKVELKF